MSKRVSGWSRSVSSAAGSARRSSTITAWPRAASPPNGVAPGTSLATRARSASTVIGYGRRPAASAPLERALAPDVGEAERQHEHEDRHLDEAEHPERAEDHRPGIEEDHLDVEEDEEDRGQVELDRDAPPRGAARRVAALERLGLDRRRAARPEERAGAEQHRDHDARDAERDEDGHVGEVHREGCRMR